MSVLAVNQLIEKCNEFKRPLCIGHVDYEKGLDYIEQKAIFTNTPKSYAPRLIISAVDLYLKTLSLGGN